MEGETDLEGARNLPRSPRNPLPEANRLFLKAAQGPGKPRSARRAMAQAMAVP